MVSRESPVSPAERLAANLADVVGRIGGAARRVGRDPAAVTLVAVTKGVPAAVVRLLGPLGVRDVGESRIQEAEPKMDALGPGLRWHLIGHLQRNKARRAVARFSLLHSLDSLRLLDHLDEVATSTGTVASALLQVNISAEEQKHGIEPDDVRTFLVSASGRPGVRIEGLMGMASYVADPEEARESFSLLARIRREADAASWYRGQLPELSMGMTNDFEIAVEEGATMVRVGTAVFRDVGPHPASEPPPTRAEEHQRADPGF